MWKDRARTGALVGIAGVSLYLLLPGLLAVFASWRSLSHLDWPYAILVLACEAASFVCLWDLDRTALNGPNWFAVGTAQLSGNAVGRILPGGGATATAFTASMLRRTGIDTGEAVAGLAASTGLQIATRLALPVLALPAILGGAPISHSLATAAYLGLAVLVLLLAAGAAAFTSDAPLELAGRGLQWLLNATVRRHRHVSGLPEELLANRDFIRRTLGERWQRAVLAAAANTGFDYLALLCALRAVGADPRPSLVLLAFTAAALLSLIPFTPGGVGFVEAGLVGTLTLAGVSGPDALAATLLYRLVAYWLPIPAGGVAYLLFRRRYEGSRDSRRGSAPSPISSAGAGGDSPIVKPPTGR
ncbi:MAG TPA: YbhN family protein [Gaiellaceae bacterium]